METTTTCGDLPLLLHLPEDVLIKILVCLPVQSLLRFKFVCKSCRKLIQTPFFIDLHTTFNSSSSSSKFGAFIIQTIEYSRPGYEYEGEIKLFKLSSCDGDATGGEDDEDNGEDDDQKKNKMVFKVDDLGFFPFYKDTQLSDTLHMVGSCNGIICLHDAELMDDSKGGACQHYSNLRDVCLWNPATRQFRILPKSIPIKEKQDYIGNWLEDFIRFGFDVKTKDYKVLRITPWEKKGRWMCQVQVYSLSTDSWRLLEGINSLPVQPIYSRDLFHNHGIIDQSAFGLLLFDFTKEIFTTMQLPSYSGIVSSYLGDRMVVLSIPRIDDREGGYEYYDIWVLNEQHDSAVVNKESWTKLHSFRIKSRGHPYTEPRCTSNNGEFALISTTAYDHKDGYSREKLQLFNLVTKETIKDFTIGDGKCRVGVYKESLVSIMGGGNVFLGDSSQRTHVSRDEI